MGMALDLGQDLLQVRTLSLSDFQDETSKI